MAPIPRQVDRGPFIANKYSRTPNFTGLPLAHALATLSQAAPRMPLSRTYRLFLLAFLLPTELLAQNNGARPATRTGMIQEQRMEKAGNTQNNQRGRIQASALRIGHVIRVAPVRFMALGGGTGAGLAVGSGFERYGRSDQIRWRLWGIGLLHGFYSAGTSLELRNISRHGVHFAFEGSHADAPQLEYYGPGPDSSIHNRTGYRREETLFDFGAGLRAHAHVTPACRLGELLINVGPGTDNDFPSTETVFSPVEAPGINVQSNFLIAGCSAKFDVRDLPDDPHSGTYVAGVYERYDAQTDNVFSFHRLSAEADHYLPFFNKKRVVALRAATVLDWHSANQVVPFYLQPTLGSDTELRGFRRYRFYDENSIAVTAEYRWEINTGFDMALFLDGGQVFHRPGEISLSDLKSSAGFGFRFKSRTRVLVRLDVGFSNEGSQVWLKFGRLF
jgi:Omp85 superfamily domain